MILTDPFYLSPSILITEQLLRTRPSFHHPSNQIHQELCSVSSVIFSSGKDTAGYFQYFTSLRYNYVSAKYLLMMADSHYYFLPWPSILEFVFSLTNKFSPSSSVSPLSCYFNCCDVIPHSTPFPTHSPTHTRRVVIPPTLTRRVVMSHSPTHTHRVAMAHPLTHTRTPHYVILGLFKYIFSSSLSNPPSFQ